MANKERFLYDYQKKSYDEMIAILEREFGVFNGSNRGLGKTDITCALAADFGFKMFVVALNSTLSNWIKTAKLWNAEIIECMSYESLQGAKHRLNNDKILKHGYLKFENDNYTTTQKFDNLLKDRILLVIDESQYFKNDNSRLKSAHALVKKMIQYGQSRVILLSGTPYDKDLHPSSVLKLLGIITHDKLIEKLGGQYIPLGLGEVIEKAKEYNPELTETILINGINRQNCNIICTQLYTEIIKKHIFTNMPAQKTNEDLEISFYNFENDDVLNIQRGYNKLFKCFAKLSIFSDNEEYTIAFSKAMQSIEKGKRNIIIDKAIEVLEQNPTSKVVIYCFYIKNINYIINKLSAYGVCHINGQTNNEQRNIIINNFQKPNLDYRIFISNMKVGGVGIELDDKHGDYPRYMFIAPNFNVIDIHQGVGRISSRANTKSKATVKLVFCKQLENYENRILNALVTKSETIRDSINDPYKNITFPGEYPIKYYE